MAVGKVADFEEQIKTFKQERGTALRYALEIVMKTTNKQMTIKELRQVGEVHERMRIWMKKPQKEPTSILRAQLMVVATPIDGKDRVDGCAFCCQQRL